MNYTALQSNAPGEPRTIFGWLRLWFLLVDPVSRREYALTGCGLMAFKYLVEMAVVNALTGRFYTPLDFVNPLMSARQQLTMGAPSWFGMAWIIWALPFLWIAVGMSVRRAIDAGISPWHGLWVFVPFLNLIAMLVLAILPTSQQSIARETSRLDASPAESRDRTAEATAAVKAAIGGIAIGALYATVLVQASVYVFHDYGGGLFFGTPFVTGIAAGFLFNLRTSRSHLATMGVAIAALFFSGVALLLFAFEGVICIMMAAPIVIPLGMLGAPVGKLLADRRRRLRGGLVAALLIVPLCSSIESRLPKTAEFVVSSSVDIAATSEIVWQNVIDFPQITDPPAWYFQMGIASPSEARITGNGVGAVRECIFTTGKFVEPITAWDAPQHLAFDVREQPAPMFELTPYRDLHPPHLDGAFRSVRGEFQLEPLPDGGTRLTGRTWYALDMRPHAYWTIWSNWVVHRIHLRVLDHIKRLAEQSETDS